MSDNEKLAFHLMEVLAGSRRFENAAQSVSRMIEERGVEKIVRAGQTVYEFKFFREGKRHIIGWFDEINAYVNFIRDAATGGSSREFAFVLVGEAGNGKTFFVEYICSRYREFLNKLENRRHTFNFVNLTQLGKYGKFDVIQSQTYEDPLILAMNLFESREKNKEYLSRAGFDDRAIDKFYSDYRPFGACSDHIWNDIREYCDGKIEKMLEFIRIVPIRITENSGAITSKYSSKDKITASATDLLGEEDPAREYIHLTDPTNPFRYNVRKGALARVGGGGIHFCDEFFKQKKDLVNVYLNIIQPPGGGPRNIELDGFRWPIDTLIIATSNNYEYNRFVSEKEEAPIKDRCKICYVAHNTDYKLQKELTRYAIGTEQKVSVMGDPIHEDPNLIYALSVALTLTRLPHSEKLTPVEMMKLEAGETAGEKNVQDILEVKKQLNANPDVTKRWGQTGVGHRGLGRVIQNILAMPETHEGKCRFARNCFEAIEREVFDQVSEAVVRDKCLKDLEIARKLYRREIRTSIFNAFRDDPEAVRKDVMNYINMIIGIGSDQLVGTGTEKTWRYRDPQTGEMKPIKIDETFINSVEGRIGLHTKEAKENFRKTIRQLYAQRKSVDPNCEFMDNETLVKAVTDFKLNSDVAGSAGLAGALANRTDEESKKIYNRMTETMFHTLGYCKTCAEKTIEYFIEPVDED